MPNRQFVPQENNTSAKMSQTKRFLHCFAQTGIVFCTFLHSRTVFLSYSYIIGQASLYNFTPYGMAMTERPDKGIYIALTIPILSFLQQTIYALITLFRSYSITKNYLYHLYIYLNHQKQHTFSPY